MVATMRDIVEAMAQRWNRHVIGYDLKQQIGILQRRRRGEGMDFHQLRDYRDRRFEGRGP